MIRRSLDQSNVELWFTFLDEVNHTSLLREYDALLSSEERVRLQRFHFEKDQRVHLITRVLVRTVLSRYVEMHPADWVFRRNAYGRPEIEHESEMVRSIRFNVSHTAGLVMLGVVANREIGVDIESVNKQVTADLADQFLTEPEKEAFRTISPDEQPTRLFEYWTLKEAYVKAKGLGLSFPLKKVSFSFESEKLLNVSYDIQAKANRESWQHLLMQVSSHHVASVCVEQRDNSSLRIVSRKVVPLLREELFYPSAMYGSHIGRADLPQTGNTYLDA